MAVLVVVPRLRTELAQRQLLALAQHLLALQALLQVARALLEKARQARLLSPAQVRRVAQRAARLVEQDLLLDVLEDRALLLRVDLRLRHVRRLQRHRRTHDVRVQDPPALRRVLVVHERRLVLLDRAGLHREARARRDVDLQLRCIGRRLTLRVAALHERRGQDLLEGEPLVWLALQDPLDQVLRVLLDAAGVAHYAGLYVGLDLLVLLALEGRVAVQQLVEKHPDGPDVDREVVGLVGDDLGRHVLVGAAEGLALEVDVLGAPAEVAELEVVVAVEQEVLGLA